MNRRDFLDLTASMAVVPAVGAFPLAQGLPAGRVRARDLGIVTGELAPGPLNAITDVEGVLVGHSTIVRGEGALKKGDGPVRTGVTAVLPHRDVWRAPVLGATHTLNGDGELTGVHWVRDLETIAQPVLITNTASVGAVHEAAIAYAVEKHGGGSYLPVVGETWDGRLNDIDGLHVKREHVYAALDARGRRACGRGQCRRRHGDGLLQLQRRHRHGVAPVGRVSRRFHGRRAAPGQFRPAQHVDDWRRAGGPRDSDSRVRPPLSKRRRLGREGSVIVVVATDAPVSSRQLERMSRRATLGLARTGTWSGNGSGDIFVAFSTANRFERGDEARERTLRWYNPAHMDPLFLATVEAVEEAVLNALMKAETMTGINNTTVEALPYDRLRDAMKKYTDGDRD